MRLGSKATDVKPQASRNEADDLKSNIQVKRISRGRMQTRFEKRERKKKDRDGGQKIKQDFLGGFFGEFHTLLVMMF